MYLLFVLCFISILAILFLWNKICEKDIEMSKNVCKLNNEIKKLQENQEKINDTMKIINQKIKLLKYKNYQIVSTKKVVDVEILQKEEKTVEKVLQRILTKDINLLISRNVLVEELEENVPAKYSREVAMIQKAFQYNIGEIFLKANNENTVEARRESKIQIENILRSNNIQEKNIQKLIKIFEYALSWKSVNSIDCDEKIKDDNNVEILVNNKEQNNQDNKEKQIEIEKIKKQKIEELWDIWDKSIQKYNAIIEGKDFIEKTNETEKRTDSPYLNEKEQQALWDNFVQDYNNLSLNKIAETGFNKQQAKKKFMQKYQIKKITCSNYEERMRELNGIKKEYSKPIFIDYDINSNMVEQYWATCIQDKIYVIVPKLNISYVQQLHEMAGMKETFESNYKNGSYSKIKVIKPAVFHYENNKWKLILSGKLELIK